MADVFEEFFRRSPDVIFIMEGPELVDFNPPGLEMLGFPDRASLLAHYGGDGQTGVHPALISPPLQPDGERSEVKAEAMMRLARTNGSHRFDWDHRRADGTVFPSEVLLTFVGDEEHERYHVIVRDITERLTIEARLRRAERLRNLAILAGGVAHDFNNTLLLMQTHADALRGAVEEHARIHVDAIADTIEKAANLTSQLLTFSRGDVSTPQAIDLGASVESIADVVRSLAGETVDVEIVAPAEPVVVLLDPGQADQLVINLATNACDAMAEGGHLTITVRTATSGAEPIAELEVADTGAGMEPGEAEAAFEPFATSKAPGTGTGLGLAIVRAIAERGGGHVELTSSPGAGTTVLVRLPVTDRPISAPIEDRSTATTNGRSADILLVEDNPQVRPMLAKMLRTRGHRVAEAANGEEALAHVDANGLPDAIVTDVVMPGRSGPAVVEHLRSITAEPVRVVFMSGYAADIDFEHDRDDVRVLRKPFPMAALDEAVRSVLGSVEPRARRPGYETDATAAGRLVHDLRGRLFAIDIALTLAEDGATPDPSRRQALESARRASEAAGSLLDSLERRLTDRGAVEPVPRAT